MRLQAFISFICLPIVLLALSGCLSLSDNKEDGSGQNQKESVKRLGDRSYILKLPDNYSQQHSYKLLLAFHASGGNAITMNSTALFEQYSDDYIVAYPNSQEVEWNEGCDCNIAARKGVDDLGFVDEVIADIKATHNIQAGEIYAAGFSQGGLFTQNLACNRSETFKAVAIVAASMSQQLAANCLPTASVSVMMVHGLMDNVLPYQGLLDSNFGLISSPEAIKLHAQRQNGLPYPLIKPFPDLGAETISYTNGKAKYQLFTAAYGGHWWSFGDFDTSERIINFFASLQQPELPEHSSLISVNNQQFHVRAMGQQHAGPAVVLMAGPNENYHSDSAWFAALQPLLAQQYRVYSVDRLGNAYSSVDDDLSYGRFSDDLAHVLQQLQEQQLILVAFSSGSISARLFYQQHHQQFDIKAMLYIDPDIPLPHSVSLYQGYPADWYLQNLSQLLPHIASGAWTERTLNKITAERELAAQLVSAHADVMDWSYFEQVSQQRLLIANQQSRAREIAAYTADLNQYAALPMVTGIPVSVIDSDFESMAIAQAPAEQIAALQQWQQEGTQWSMEQASVSNGQYIALSDSNHLVPLQQPQKIQQALNWLSAQLQLP